jgi:hypothetical protein
MHALALATSELTLTADGREAKARAPPQAVAPSTNDQPPRPAGEPPTGLPLSVTTEAKRKWSARGCCGDNAGARSPRGGLLGAVPSFESVGPLA